MKTLKSKPKLNPQILEQASEWFVEFNEGEVGASTREEFNAWLRRSPEHIQAYLQIAGLWEDASLLNKGRTRGPDELISRALAETNVVPLEPHAQSPLPQAQSEASEPPSPVARQGRRIWFALAASIALAAVGAWLYIQHDTYSTDVGEHRSVKLSDGSTVDINSRSKLRVRFSEHERLVELLEGQALFSVTQDPQRPFVVHSDETRVRAVGTRFDVYRRSHGGTVVTVLEGRVAVASPLLESRGPLPSALGGEAPALVKEDPILLSAGQRLTVSPIAFTAPEPANVEAATAWTRRQIVFQASPLSEVIEEFNRYNTTKMAISDPALESTRISGVFSSTDPNSLLRFLRNLPNVDVRETGDEIQISSR